MHSMRILCSTSSRGNPGENLLITLLPSITRCINISKVIRIKTDCIMTVGERLKKVSQLPLVLFCIELDVASFGEFKSIVKFVKKYKKRKAKVHEKYIGDFTAINHSFLCNQYQFGDIWMKPADVLKASEEFLNIYFEFIKKYVAVKWKDVIYGGLYNVS